MQIPHALRSHAGRILKHPVVITVTTVITLFCLFGQDINIIATTSDATELFDGLTIFAVVIFMTEIILNCLANQEYPASFFFLLDVVSTGTLLLDISFLGINTSGDSISQATRASRVGARATRVVRIIRLVRLLRLVRVFKIFNKPQLREDASEDRSVTSDLQHAASARNRPQSKTEKALSQKTSQRMVIIILLIVFIQPQIETKPYFSSISDIHSSGLSAVSESYRKFVADCRTGDQNKTLRSRLAYERTLASYVKFGCSARGGCVTGNQLTSIAWIGGLAVNESDACISGSNFLTPRLNESTKSGLAELLSEPWTSNCDPSYMSTSGVSLLENSDCPSKLRSIEKALLSRRNDDVMIEIVIDQRSYTRSEAFLSIYRTLAICVILAIGSSLFSRGAFKLVLEPIERMLGRVERIRDDPMNTARTDDDTIRRYDAERLKLISRYNTATNMLSRWNAKRQLSKLYNKSLETATIEKTLLRIGSLLALGFGQAGAAIVAHNIKSNDFSINAMLPGKRVDGIFASIRIANFDVISIVLKDKVIKFINQIAEIVHGISEEYHGTPNKTDGGSFLIVWRLCNDPEKDQQLHEMAAVACVKMYIAIRRSLELHEYRSLPPLVQRLPGFCVSIIIGLHRGWAIEGAIGSNLKIDASYVGPDVLLTETIARQNNKYGTIYLATGNFVNACTLPFTRRLFRRIDRLKLSATTPILDVYAFDIDQTAELLTQYEIEHCVQSTSMNTSRNRQRREREKRRAQRWSADMLSHLYKDSHFRQMRTRYDDESTFRNLFLKGFLNYECGEWRVAADALTQSQAELGMADGPSVELMRFIAEFECKPPVNWEGFRRL
jgi:hypothetical protein